ncbi:MAG: ATP-dependent helicase [Candidatus Thiodiazotropha sp. (ex Lucinoma kastoroae)]|nr:ATP-dependent helicase [Candidatus Thiodiazotropha sp. (ex Lucinoma kastoroae)]MCU7860544.1 ATP-dependent helicase [Candidatus Thiodiazotropha sp. (ex Lucinoma kastoroae)]
MPLRFLTDEQLNAVTYQGNMLLTACPGSGKTRTLVSRIAWSLSEEIWVGGKRRIIAITYTNVAADTILERLDAFGIDNENLWVGTIHSFCLDWILKPYLGYSERLSKGYRILDEYEQRKLVDSIKRQFNIGIFDAFPTQLDQNNDINVAAGSNLYQAVEEYHRTLGENRWIDFNLILTISRKILLEYPAVSTRLARLFASIMVDEYQDTNQVQYDILASIIGHGKTDLTLIGDVDQAIYTGLGAVVKDAAELRSEFGLHDLYEMSLSGCYRSTQTIIDFYRAFQDHPINIESLTTNSQSDSNVFYKNDIDRDQLGEYVGSVLTRHLREGIELNEIIILAPQWTDVIRLARDLRQAMPELEFNAPGISPIPRSQDNPWFNLVKLFFTEIHPDNFSRRRRLSTKVVADMEEIRFSFSGFDNPAKQVIKTINSIFPNRNCEVVVFLDSLINCFCQALNYNLVANELAHSAKEALKESTTTRISQFNLANDASILDTYFNSTNGIEVASCHSTKGEEYDVVIATGLLEGKLPHWNDIINQSQDYSDYMARRLLYVISSRARKYLYLVSEQGHVTRNGYPLLPTPQLLFETQVTG